MKNEKIKNSKKYPIHLMFNMATGRRKNSINGRLQFSIITKKDIEISFFYEPK